MPEISIVIPAFNCLAMTQACLASLESTIGARKDFEVIVADDASSDGTPEWLRTLPAPRYRLYRSEVNRGYAAVNNAAAKLATGRFLLLLNNDTVLLPGWLEPMLRVVARAPNAGVVGNIQREVESGLIDHTGVIFASDGMPYHAGKDTVSPPRAAYGKWAAVTAACCVMRRELFVHLDGFDEVFRNSFDDIDFCLRVRRAGFQNYVANKSVIYHHISPSPGRRDYDAQNGARFSARWGEVTQRLAREQKVEYRDEHQYRDGWRYLRKHALRPWRFNASRLRRAIAGVTQRVPSRQNPASD